MIKLGLKENPNIIIIENANANIAYTKILDFYILGIHDLRDKKQDAIKDYESLYNSKIDIILSGHFHTSNQQNVAIDKEVIGVPSICRCG